jgi:hypothetical protein
MKQRMPISSSTSQSTQRPIVQPAPSWVAEPRSRNSTHARPVMPTNDGRSRCTSGGGAGIGAQSSWFSSPQASSLSHSSLRSWTFSSARDASSWEG